MKKQVFLFSIFLNIVFLIWIILFELVVKQQEGLMFIQNKTIISPSDLVNALDTGARLVCEQENKKDIYFSLNSAIKVKCLKIYIDYYRLKDGISVQHRLVLDRSVIDKGK